MLKLKIVDEISRYPVRVSVTLVMGATDSLCNESIGNLGKKKEVGKVENCRLFK